MMDFTPLTAADRTEPYVPPQTLRDRGWRQMKKNRLALWGLAIVVVMSLLAIAGPWLAPYTYADQDLTAANAWPSAAHWFGTDYWAVTSSSASSTAPAFPCPSASSPA